MDEAHFEHADRITQAAREAAVARAHQLTTGTGQPECLGCGDDIPARRRAAFPAAIRCIHCQTLFERGQSQFTTER